MSKATKAKPCTVEVYTDDGRVFEYDVRNAMKGREHAAAIINTGLRYADGEDLEWLPPHRILKVKVPGGEAGTKYPVRVRAT